MDATNSNERLVGRVSVTLMEGERDLKPRPEARVNWPDGKPPGGQLSGAVGDPPSANHTERRVSTENKYRRRFFVKVAGLGDSIEELDEEPLSEPVLRWLATQLNNDRTCLMVNAPGVGSRGPKESQLDVQLWAGFTSQGSAHFDPQGQDGPGVYAEVEVIPPWIERVGAMIDSPGGIDLTAFYKNSVVSLDLVVRSRGTGKVISQIETKSTNRSGG